MKFMDLFDIESTVMEMAQFIYGVATFCNRNGYYKTQSAVNIAP